MQGHDFIFCLNDRPGTNPNFWGIDANGKAKLTATPYFLEFSPDGWVDLAIQNIRNKKYWGVDRSVTIPFGYVEDGATILKTIFYTYGPEAPVYLKVCRLTLDFTPAPNGILAFTAGGSPFTPNTTSSGTITGTPGSTVLVRFSWVNPVIGDTLTGDFDGVNFSIDYLSSPPTFTLIIPAGGVINFNVLFTQIAGSPSTAGMAMVNALGTTAGEYGFWYKQTYVGQVDGSSFNHKGSKVTVATLEDGLPKFLKANENTVIELPMNVPEAIYWKADGIVLHNKATFFLGNGGLPNDAQSHVVDLNLVHKEFEAVGDVFSSTRTVAHDNVELGASGQKFFVPSKTDTVEVTYDFILNIEYVPPPGINPSAIVYVQISHYDPVSGFIVSADTIFQRDVAHVIPGEYHIQGTMNINVIQGQQLYLWTRCNVAGASGDSNMLFTYSGVGLFELNYKSRFHTTYIRALRPQYIFKKLLEFLSEGTYITDDGNGLDNYFGQNKHFNKPFSPGNSIRGFDDAVMKISWAMFFQFWDCFDAVGIVARGNKVTFDRKKNLVDFNSSISLGEAANLSVALDKEKAYNELAIGYPEIKNEAGVLNGNDEFNCGFLFSTGTTLSPARMEKVPQIKASCYEIELIRIATDGKTSTDYKNDNEIYCVHLLNTEVPAAGDIPAHFLLDRTLNAFATGLLEPETVFNIELSPHRNLNRNGDWLRSCLMFQDGKFLRYKSSDKNNALITTQIITGNPVPVIVEEKKDVLIGSLAAPFFIPLIFTVDVIVPFNLLDLLDANPLQLFDFDFYGVNYKGLMNEVEIAPGSEKSQTYKLLCAPDNDLSTLIDYYG